MGFYLSYALTLVAGFCLALIFTPLSRALAISSGFIDRPRGDRAHRNPTPFLGGLAVAMSAGLAFTMLAPNVPLLAELWEQGALPRISVPAILLLATGGLVVGLIDDRFGVSPRIKLLVQSALSICFLATLSFQGAGLSPWLWPVGLLWMVGLTNAFNLLDNLDGILGGVGAMIGLFLGVLALNLGRPDLAVLAMAGAGACVGFLCFNFPPATIYLGDAGAFFIGFLFAGVGWELGGSQFLALGSVSAAITLVLAYPIFDVCFVTITRLLDRRPVSEGGVDHTTHRMHVFMRGHRGLIPVYLLNTLNGLVGIVAFLSPPPAAWALVAVMAALYAALGVMLARVSVKRSTLDALAQGDRAA